MQRDTPRETDRRRPLRADGIRSTPAVSRRTLTVDKRIRTGRPLPREIAFPRSRVRATVLGNPETETLPSINI
jgi:hypothetical protein